MDLSHQALHHHVSTIEAILYGSREYRLSSESQLTSQSPNPWKVVIILEELGVPYELEPVAELKGPIYTAINPNGRVPALQDPNTGVTTWESASCIEYLIETYDKDHKLHYSGNEHFTENNWKHFQMSGQGPYFGQKAWFSNFHPEKVPSAEDRYSKEIERVLGVLDSALDKPYLVGDRVSYVDLMFVPWNNVVAWLVPDFKWQEKYPRSYAWHQRLVQRESVKRMETKKAEVTKK